MRRIILTLATVVLGVVIGLMWSRRGPVRTPAPVSPAAVQVVAPSPARAEPPPSTLSPAIASPSAPLAPAAPPEARITLADELNAPTGNVQQDLRIVRDVLDAWRSNYPRWGNPVGENVEITAALTGTNSLQLALIPKNHPAVNANGELCDRWGTPFRFHQLSGEFMQIRSAGPDRKFGTPDDALLSPEMVPAPKL